MSTPIEQIKDRLDLAELVREYAPELKKAGISWKARCPFHQEKTPSFVVSPEKGIWHCFGCGAGGDAFAFVQKMEGVEFIDALRLLAERAGVKLERRRPEETSERSRILDILRLAAGWYHQALLRSKSGEVARRYLAERQVSDKIRDEWQLGFAPDAWDELLKYLHSRGLRDNEIAPTGLIVANDRGGYYDRFRYRLLFPITNVHGAVAGFTARKLREEDVGGKYINTPETAVYHKSEILYGLSGAKQEIRKHDLAIVVEGNMDCLSSHQAGVTNVAAASGTALTPEQVRLLKRFTKNICLAFDPDSAGQAALMRGLETAWQEDMLIRVAKLPSGLDPDNLIKRSAEEWREAIAQALPFMDWLFAKVASEHDLTAAEGKKACGRAFLPWIRRLPDPIEQTHYLQLLAGKINVSETILRQTINRPPGKRHASFAENRSLPARVNVNKATVWEQAAGRLLALVLLLESGREFFAEFSLEWLPNDKWRSLYKSAHFFYDKHTAMNADQWLSELPADWQSLAREAIMSAEELKDRIDAAACQKEQKDLIGRLKSHYLQDKLKAMREQIANAEKAGNVEELQRHLSEWQRLNKELNGDK